MNSNEKVRQLRVKSSSLGQTMEAKIITNHHPSISVPIEVENYRYHPYICALFPDFNQNYIFFHYSQISELCNIINILMLSSFVFGNDHYHWNHVLTM